MIEETQQPEHFPFLEESLSPMAKKLLKKCHNATFVSPLEYCRLMQEDAKGKKYMALIEVEHYLINEP